MTFEPNEPAAQLVDEVRRLTGVTTFDAAVILGSGWSEAANLGRPLGHFDYADWPCFPGGQIAGHGGRLLTAAFSSWKILFFVGRFHCYQGIDAFQASFPVRLAAALGVPRILLSCATGGINPQFAPGDFMLVDDHLNLMGDNPLIGLHGDTFIDLTDLYETRLYDQLNVPKCTDLRLHRGILAALSGPSYETPAEVRFLQRADADVVSMSTVPEAIMARYLRMRVAAVAFVANAAAGLSRLPLSHADVLETSRHHADRFPQLVRYILESWQDLDAIGSTP